MLSPSFRGMVLALVACVLVQRVAFGQAESEKKPGADQETAAQKERAETLLKWTRKFAQDTRISVLDKDNTEAVELRAEPVMRYSDHPRFISDATLWVWTCNARPVAIQKVEASEINATPMWTICFASFSDGLVEAKWPYGESFKTTKPGWTFEPIPSADPPAEKPAARSLQMRALSRRFSGSVFSETQNSKLAMRLLPKPIYEYSDPETKLPRGAIFGLADNGTNPSVLIVIEARPNKDGTLAWHQAHSRMTADIGKVTFDEATIWEFKPWNDPITRFDNWRFYAMQRNLPAR